MPRPLYLVPPLARSSLRKRSETDDFRYFCRCESFNDQLVHLRGKCLWRRRIFISTTHTEYVLSSSSDARSQLYISVFILRLIQLSPHQTSSDLWSEAASAQTGLSGEENTPEEVRTSLVSRSIFNHTCRAV